MFGSVESVSYSLAGLATATQRQLHRALSPGIVGLGSPSDSSSRSCHYLWLNSSQLINGYGPSGISACAVWDWMFLFGHLVWATGFMFLISWRGYWKDKPVAFSNSRRVQMHSEAGAIFLVRDSGVWLPRKPILGIPHERPNRGRVLP